jgi:Histidine phosphatase superfamily (branch 1)
LVRHGQYFDNARSAEDMKLTALGREQLEYTGKRLDQMNITFNRMIHSGMVRAVESAQIINEQLTRKLEFVEDRNLTEGLPVAPIPYAGLSQQYVDVRRASFFCLIERTPGLFVRLSAIESASIMRSLLIFVDLLVINREKVTIL